VRVALFSLILLCGIVMVVLGLIMPAHLRAVDPYVMKAHGATGKSLVETAAETARRNPAVGKLLLGAAEQLHLTGTDVVVEQLREAAADRVRARTVLERLEEQESGRIQVAETPVLTALRKARNREQVLNSLQSLEAKQILQTRDRTNWTVFAPAKAAAGAPLDVAVLTTAFLMEQRAFAPASRLRDEVLQMTADPKSPLLEEFYLSIFALAKRFSSEQIIALTENLPTSAGLHSVTRLMQEKPAATHLLYTSAVVSKNGGATAQYVDRFPLDAEKDLGFALTTGVQGLNLLLAKQQPVYRCTVYDVVSQQSWLRFIYRRLLSVGTNLPVLALFAKFLLISGGAFVLAYSSKFRPARPVETHFVFFPRFSMARRAAFACVFLLLALVLGEPYLAQGEQRKPAVSVHFPILGAASAAPEIPKVQSTSTPMLDQHTILAIATFLVLQGLIYAICLVKLAEIRKQPVADEIKLKLLENEDHLFDGGLYCGLFGTAASLILLTLGVIKPSLISAYSSTLFGILFVALLKIGHVRPLKRRLLLDIASKPAVI
jgi:hypothetical protein